MIFCWKLFHMTMEDIYNFKVLNKIFKIYKTMPSIWVLNFLALFWLCCREVLWIFSWKLFYLTKEDIYNSKVLYKISKNFKTMAYRHYFDSGTIVTLLWRGFVIFCCNLFHLTREDIYNFKVLNKILKIFKTMISIWVLTALCYLQCYVILILSLLYSKLNMGQYW